MVTQRSRAIAFDLDGVLIDSRRANEEAYRAAGVEMPDDAWGKASTEWMDKLLSRPDIEKVHERKQALYPQMLALWAQPLAGAAVAYALADEGHIIYVVTSASSRSAWDALRFLGLAGRIMNLSSVPGSAKGAVLRRLAPRCYVDDLPRDCPIPVVRFTNDAEELMRRIRRFL